MARLRASFHHLEPFYAERYRLPASRWLPEPPTTVGEEVEYGLDAADRPVIVREHSPAGGFQVLLADDDDAVVGHRYATPAGRCPAA